MERTNELMSGALRPINSVVEEVIGRRISPASSWRWRTKGVRGVRLACYFVAGQWCTTADALREFIHRSSEAGMPPDSASVEERDTVTARRLEAAGLLRT